MSKRLEFGPDQDLKPRKPQALELSGSQLCILHLAGDRTEVEKDEKPSPKIPSSLCSQTCCTPSFFGLLLPIPQPQVPLLEGVTPEDEEPWEGQRDVPVGILGLREGQQGQGYHPARPPGLGMSARRRKVTAWTLERKQTQN